jgi:hypothetical protein
MSKLHKCTIWMAAAVFSAAMPVSAQTCTRDALKATADNYLKAIAMHNPTGLKLAPNARITENAAGIKPGEGLFKTGGKAQFERTIVDTARCSTLTQAVIEEQTSGGSAPALIAVRLRNEAGRVTEVETVIARKGDFAFKPEGVIATASQDWATPLPAAARRSREYMNAEADKYYVMFEDHSIVPAFAKPCNRWENGTMTTPKGDCSWSAQVMKHPRRRFPVTDTELGATGVITNFRDDWLDVHIFKFDTEGKVTLIQAVDGPGTKGTGWPYDN